MRFGPSFLTSSCLLLGAAMFVAADGKAGNSGFPGAEELSAAALNVRVNFHPYEETWREFKDAFGRQYQSAAEEAARYHIFVQNVKEIELHNAQFQHGNTTYWMGINRFTDMTAEECREFNKLRIRTDVSESLGRLRCSHFVPPSGPNDSSSATVDWRKKGYVTPVKNQGSCGSCWAFSVTGTLEGQHFRKTKKLVSLSEQQLVDCAGDFGPKGCQGGNPTDALAYIYGVGGIESESDYPYKGKQQRNCGFTKSKVVATLRACKTIKPGSEKDLAEAVRTQGPVSVTIHVSDSFRNYHGGVFVDANCDKTWLNHAVLAVGYGTTGTLDYWIVKNSWGATWGDQGYILMARNYDNMCGIATDANFPVV